MKIVTKLAVSSILSHRVRSIIVCAAVILTSVLFITVMSVTFNIFGGLQLMLAAGSDFHASVSASDLNLTPAGLLEEIESNKTVKEAYIFAAVGDITSENSNSTGRVYSVSSEKALPHLFIKITEGQFPLYAGGIALNILDFPDTQIGQSIKIDARRMEIAKDGSGIYNEHPLICTVSALFESEADRGAQPAAVILYDETEPGGLAAAVIYLNFYNSLNIAGKHNALTIELGQYVREGAELRSNVNNAYLSARYSVLSPTNILFVMFSVAIIFFCAFLLIYNIYSIALTQDMRSYGMLGVIGMTYKQLRSMIRCQALLYYAVSVPVGTAAGYFIGWKLLVPVFMSMSGEDINYRFNILIIISSAFLTLFTLLFSALRPLHRIKKLTPVEAVSGGGKLISKKERKGSDVNPFTLAFYSAARNPGRLTITSLSAALSVILLILLSSLVTVIHDIGVNDLGMTDIRLTPLYQRHMMTVGSNQVRTYQAQAQLGSAEGVIGDGVFEAIRTLDGIGETWAIRYAEADVKANERSVAEAQALIDKFPEEDREVYNTSRLEQITGGSVHSLFIGIPDDLCQYIRITEDEFYSGNELFDGTHVISVDNLNIYYNQGNLSEMFSEGETISSDQLSHDYAVITPELQYPFDALWYITGFISWEYCVQLFIMPESVFAAEFGEGAIYSILCDYAGTPLRETAALSEEERRFRGEVDNLTADYTVTNGDITTSIEVSGRFDGREELQNRLFAIRLTGYSLCAIIFAIGLINMINSSLSSVMERRREYAMLEAVGMTGRQMQTMMLTEGFIGGALAIAITLIIGAPAVKLFMNAVIIGKGVSVNIIPAIVMLALELAVSALTSLVSFRNIRKTPLTGRLRVE